MSGMRLEKTAAIAALLALTAGPAVAQDSGWTYDLSAYLWVNDTGVTADTPRGEASAELSFSDALDALDFAFMGTVEARNGRWGLIGDLLYFDLSAEGDTPRGALFSKVKAESTTTVLSSYVAYRAYEDARLAFDIGAGFRAFWMSMETTFVGAGLPSETFDHDRDWIDPIVAARLRMAFNDAWFGSLTLDAGGTDDTSTWQALATVGYRLNESWTLQGGYRYLEAKWDTDFGESSLDFSGPILGATYRF